jgi:carbonic anhydrase
VLGVKDVIVCGHSHCGAMKGLHAPESLTGLPAVASWLEHAETTRRIVRENYADEAGDELLTTTIKENVLVQLDNLRTHPSIAARLGRGDVHLHGWVYEIETGKVYAYDVKERAFRPLAPGHQPGARPACSMADL